MSATSSIGPISGINYGNLITGLTASDQSAIDAIGTRISTLQSESAAIISLSAVMTGLKVASASFVTPAIFQTGVATSANPNVVTAQAGVGTPTGNYSFNVQQLASASQDVTQGFANTTTALGLSGTLSLQLGGGELNNTLNLSQLNGGNGVARGSIRITDKSGASTVVDLSHAVDINDVIDDINSATGVNVQASVDGDHLVLNDNSGGAGSLTVANAGGTTTASDLGLTTAASGATLTGTSLTKLNANTTLDSLNDGNGVRTAGLLTDFTITGADGTAVPISLNGANTIGDVISAINKAGQADGITAAVSADGGGITLSDSGGGPITVAAQNGSLAAYDLGIQDSGSGGTLVGTRVASELSGPLLQNLNGGNQGQTGDVLPQSGTITINGQTIDLTGDSSLNQVIAGINANTQGVNASLDSAGTGITLSSNAASFTVADGTGNLAGFLNIAGTSTASATGSQIASGDLNLRYLSNNTQLSTLNGGSGVAMGAFNITDGNGNSATITLSANTTSTIGDVIQQINSAHLAVTARINDTGDGILLTNTGGAAGATVTDLNGGTSAANLGIAGSFTDNTLDGSFKQSITIASTDTLADIAKKINSANPNVSASIINDGSGASPYRLSIASVNSGSAGQLVLDGAGTGLNITSLVQGQNAAIVYGGNANGTGGLLSTSASNTITGLVPSMSITLTGVGNTTVAVNNDPSQVTTAVQTFVTDYNSVISNINTATAFDASDPTQNGVLFGNATVQQVQNALSNFITKTYNNLGAFHSLADVGITVNQDGTLALSTSQLSQALASDPADVQKLFTTNIAAVPTDLTQTPPVVGSPAVQGIGITLSNLLDTWTNGQTGQLFDATDALQTQITQLTANQTAQTNLLTQKKNVLIEEFANLEVSIAGFQSQGSALSSIQSNLGNSSSS